MNRRLRMAVSVAAGVFLSTAVCGSELSGKWALSVENPEHVVVATLTVEFTDKAAKSCMEGQWKVVKVLSAKTRDTHFFPTSEPLSYLVENGRLTIGRNEVCDGYLWLQGPLEGQSVKGEYFSLGLGERDPLGYFVLNLAR